MQKPALVWKILNTTLTETLMGQIARLSTCNFITERHNILLPGATGSGKMYIACALGMAAVRNFLQVRYVRLPELLTDLSIARGNGTFPKAIQQYKKSALLILDELLRYPLKETEARDLLEIAAQNVRSAVRRDLFSGFLSNS